MNAKKTTFLLLTTLLVLLVFPTIVSASSLSIAYNMSNNVSISAYFPDNTSIVNEPFTINMSTFHLGSVAANISNITFIIQNASGTAFEKVWVLGSNTTANLTSYSISNLSSGLPDGNYSLVLRTTNISIGTAGCSGGATCGNSTTQLQLGGTFSLDNTIPVITVAVPAVNQTSKTVKINITVTESFGVSRCLLFLNGTQINTTNTTLDVNPALNEFLNGTYNFTTVVATDQVATPIATCNDTSIDTNFLPNTASGTGTILVIDGVAPLFQNIEFTDTEGNTKSEFEFGNAVTINCNPTDQTSGVNAAFINISIVTPASITENLSAPATSGFILPGTNTKELGNYVIICSVRDYLGNANHSNATFSIITDVPSEGGAYAIPGFKEPIAKKVIGAGVVNKLGELSDTQEARLIAETGSVTLTLDGQEHSIVVRDVLDTSVTLGIDDVEVTLNVGESKSFDLNSDQHDDVEITLNMIFHKKADLLFKKVSLAAGPAESGEVSPEGEKQSLPSSAGERKTSVVGIIAGSIIAALIILFLVLHFLRKKGGGNSEGGSKITFKPRDLGAHREHEETYSRAVGNDPSGNSSSVSSQMPPRT